MGPSLYKVGDKVQIIAREAEAYKYRFSFVDTMTNYTGRVVTIASVEISKADEEFIPDDGYRYAILEDNGRFVWASSMFRPLVAGIMSQANDTPTTIKIKVKTNQLKFNFKN